MKFAITPATLNLILLLGLTTTAFGQSIIRGTIVDNLNNEPLIGASIVVKGTTEGTVTDYDGSFELRTEQTFPLIVEVTYVGYSPIEITVEDLSEELRIALSESAITTEVVEVRGQRISEKQKAAPLTVESLDLLAIKQTPSDNFYDGLGNLKGVDLTTASLGFKVINTRGFNSTSPVRSLQLIDGVDNQAPGLNFSLGNFLGSPELDVLRVDLIQGASSAFYGPNAFNGVISITTKNPFIQKGLAASVKAGERNLLDVAFRWADDVTNADGRPWLAYKFNFAYLRADDWEARNFDPVDDTETGIGNPGRFDAVNIYGDEFNSLNDFSAPSNLTTNLAGLGIFHRIGYIEEDLVDYDTRNLKANAAIHIRTNPAAQSESPELIIASSFGTGTTVYQGDNRFSLRDILFFQNRLEFRKQDKFFLRFYSTNEDAGDSYDPYFTALRLQELAKSDALWQQDYIRYWQNNAFPRMLAAEYPQASVDNNGNLIFDQQAAEAWIRDNQDSLTVYHAEAAMAANLPNIFNPETIDFLEPGTERFQAAFDSIVSLKNNEGGTLFFDKSALYHGQGEYLFNVPGLDALRVGASARLYRPNSEGTVFTDSLERIENFEYGVYVGAEKKFTRKWILNATFRADKNQNFDWVFSPAASIVYSPDPINYLRVSFSSAVRNPTLTDQYLNLDVGRATLIGNLDGFNDLITVESLSDYFNNNFNRNFLEFFSVAPVQPEKVRTIEAGYRTTLFDKLYLDAGYYYSWYNDFLGFNIGVDAEFNRFGFPTRLDVFRVAANSENQVTTQGFSLGANYYFGTYYSINGNYSFNRLNSDVDDPIIPAFNTPEHKYNIGVSGRNVPVNLGFARLSDFGFNVNYKWVQGFLFEGSPQFTGFIDDYGLLDAQINNTFRSLNTTLKIGASNILDNRVFQTYGGPRIGRLAYITLTYQFDR